MSRTGSSWRRLTWLAVADYKREARSLIFDTEAWHGRRQKNHRGGGSVYKDGRPQGWMGELATSDGSSLTMVESSQADVAP